jgi:hypothetical protein
MIMTRELLIAGTVALSFGACASSADLERRAEMHQQQAHAATGQRDYAVASAEQRQADKLRVKAAHERDWENDAEPLSVGDYQLIPLE